METDNTYMYLSILTFLAYATAMAMAFLMWQQYTDPNQYGEIKKDLFTMHAAPVEVDYRV